MSRQLRPVPLITPGFAGLNKQQAGNTAAIGPEFALELQNVVFDDSDRIAAREGYEVLTGTGLGASVGDEIGTLHEYVALDGTTYLIAATTDTLLLSSNGGTSWSDVTGTVTAFTSSNWQFVNFYGNCIGFQDGVQPIILTSGAGTFADLVETSGAAPTGAAALSAFGRLWAVDSDKQTIKYCNLLDPYAWSVTGAGTIDMSIIWTQGTDVVKGLAAFGGSLLVFGERHIIFWDDQSASTRGMDPAQMGIIDTIEGTGLIERDTIQNIGEGDLWFMSKQGIQSLTRVVQEKNNPLISVTEPIRDYMVNSYEIETVGVKSTYNQRLGFYLLTMIGNNQVFMLDTKKRINGMARAAEWVGFTPNALLSRSNNDLLFAFDYSVGKYTGAQDGGTSYTFEYESPHLDLNDSMTEKLLKRLGTISYLQTSTDITYKWGFDFAGLSKSLIKDVTVAGIAEYNVSEYGTNGSSDPSNPNLTAGVDVSEYGGGLRLRIIRIPMSGRGRYIQVGVTVTIDGSSFALQQLDVYAKAGRMG